MSAIHIIFIKLYTKLHKAITIYKNTDVINKLI